MRYQIVATVMVEGNRIEREPEPASDDRDSAFRAAHKMIDAGKWLSAAIIDTECPDAPPIIVGAPADGA